ncbi:hypothetical protein [Nocardioides marmoraquaticus]
MASVVVRPSTPGTLLHRDVSGVVQRAVAVLAVASLALRINLHPLVPLGYAIALAALPVTLGVVRRYRGAGILVVSALMAVVGGLAISWAVGPPSFDGLDSVGVGQASRVLMVGLGSLLLLWARSVLGARVVIMVYALATWVTVVLDGVSDVNPWKFSLSVPTTLLLLSLPWVYRRTSAEVAVLFVLGAVSATQDSRSAAATMLIACALVLTRRDSATRRVSSLVVMLRLALFSVGGFLLLQAALLSGDLGEEVRQRTMEQTNTSGNVILGGRPELGAWWALIADQPWGYGIGTVPTPSEVYVAKTGMAGLGYDPNNGYVENYMFGQGFEVHSVLGDLWLLAGLPGLLLAMVAITLVVAGMSQQLGQRIASAALIYLAIRVSWDFAFGPIYSALPLLMLALALAMPEKSRPASPDPSPART